MIPNDFSNQTYLLYLSIYALMPSYMTLVPSLSRNLNYSLPYSINNRYTLSFNNENSMIV
jgi:hypothetical protein